MKKILIEGIEKGILITTYRDYIKSVEKISANVIRVEFE